MADKNTQTGPGSFYRSWVGKFGSRDRVLIVILFFALLAILSASVAYAEYLDALGAKVTYTQKLLSSMANAVVGGLFIAFLFAVLQKLDVLLPIERKLTGVHDSLNALSHELDEQTKTLSGKMSDDIERASTQFVKVISAFEGYEHYQKLWEEFGIRQIAGVESSANERPKRYLPNSILVDEVLQADETTVIHYMNTFMEQTEWVGDELIRAVGRGACLEILLMDPNEQHLVTGRFDDAYKHPPQHYRNVDVLKQKLVLDAGILCDVQDQANSADKKHPNGQMQIRFYRDSVNYPLVAISKLTEGKRRLVRTYTGFFGAYSSEVMPYIKWEDGTYNVQEHLVKIFRQKWDKNSECTDFRRTDNGRNERGGG